MLDSIYSSREGWERFSGKPHKLPKQVRVLPPQHCFKIGRFGFFCDERIDLYLARELGIASATPDEDEVIRVERVSFAEAMRMVRDGEIVDAKTIAALYRARDLLEA